VRIIRQENLLREIFSSWRFEISHKMVQANNKWWSRGVVHTSMCLFLCLSVTTISAWDPDTLARNSRNSNATGKLPAGNSTMEFYWRRCRRYVLTWTRRNGIGADFGAPFAMPALQSTAAQMRKRDDHRDSSVRYYRVPPCSPIRGSR